MIRRSFVIEPREGDVIRGDVRVSDGPLPPSAVVVVHGFKGFKDWGFFPHTAERLAEAGHAVVSFNFSRNGVGEDLQRFGELEKFGRNTLSMEVDEIRLVLGRVVSGELLGGVPERVGLLGHSRGGGDAVVVASEDQHVASLVTWNAVATFDRWTEEAKKTWRSDGRIWIANARTRQQMPLDVTLLEDFEANRERLDILAAAERVRVPWLVVHGTADETVDPEDSRALAAAGPTATLHRVEGAGHTFQAKHPFDGAPPELEDALGATLEHFRRTLGG